MDISKVAQLSHLKLSEAEKVEFQGQLEAILAHVKSLEGVDTSGVLSRPVVDATPLRDDDHPEAAQVVSSINLVEAAGGHVQGLFEVPQAVGSDSGSR